MQDPRTARMPGSESPENARPESFRISAHRGPFRFTLLGYPGFPTLLFLVAGSLGLWLVVNIVTHDRSPKLRK